MQGGICVHKHTPNTTVVRGLVSAEKSCVRVYVHLLYVYRCAHTAYCAWNDHVKEVCMHMHKPK
jgi:hypothetical protein